jgi:hypothetical protein
MESDNLTPRQQRAAERILEDEGLTGGLVDEPASHLVRWASEAAVRAAATTFSDEQVNAALAAIRQAARQAARQAGADQDVVGLAQAALEQASPQLGAAPPPVAEPPAAEPQPSALSPQPSALRRRIESLRVRLISLISHRTN